MTLNPKLLRFAGYVLVIAPIVLEVVAALASKQTVDWNQVVAKLVTALGGSQVVKRFGDVPAEKVDAKVAARVEQVLASLPPAAQEPTP